MPESNADAAAPAAMNTASLNRWQKRLVLLLSLLFAVVPFFFIGDLSVRGVHVSDLDASGFFFSLGILPGALGIVYHVLLANTRRSQGRELLDQYYAFRASRAAARAQDRRATAVDESGADPLGAIAASLFLTGIFLLIAVFAGYEASEQRGVTANGVQGMMYAGLGAYVAVLYYMVARLYANALSSRFLMTSALRTASAVALGWVFGIVGVTALTGAPSGTADTSSTGALAANAVLFLAGLFHNMAIESLRKRASKLFGSDAVTAGELPLTAVEGIDDTTAELLTEHGVASIQHLATSEPGDLCDRTILPLDRTVDWIDQALLMRYLKSGITVSRGLGIRSATDLSLVHMRGDSALLGSLAEKAGVPPAAIEHIALGLRGDYLVALIYEIAQGKPFPAALTTTAPAATTTTTTAAATATIPIKSDTASASTVQP
ncbi:MAG TPA: hypothetical protein VND45_02120 [Thermoanaerobaculia bacterium]|jgi:hypothetical protein|nr:hypothetical protein [Thermoanaerobaculia bacterium]